MEVDYFGYVLGPLLASPDGREPACRTTTSTDG